MVGGHCAWVERIDNDLNFVFVNGDPWIGRVNSNAGDAMVAKNLQVTLKMHQQVRRIRLEPRRGPWVETLVVDSGIDVARVRDRPREPVVAAAPIAVLLITQLPSTSEGVDETEDTGVHASLARGW